MRPRHIERHLTERLGWLRPAVLGANDGIISTASLVLGFAAAHATHGTIMLSGVAGLVAGSMSMAAGEYVSVCSQMDPDLAGQVADQLTAHDALGAHVRDELGISEVLSARPLQAAISSATSFAVGASMPLIVAFTTPEANLIAAISVTALLFLASLGGVAAYTGGACITSGALRMTFWGALAMLLTAGVGALFS